MVRNFINININESLRVIINGLLRIPKLMGSETGQPVIHHGFPKSLQKNSGIIVPWLPSRYMTDTVEQESLKKSERQTKKKKQVCGSTQIND